MKRTLTIRNPKYTVLLIIALSLCIYFCAVADQTVADYTAYNRFYERCIDVPVFTYELEPLYVLASKTARFLGLNYNAFFGVLCCFGLIMIWIAIRDYSDNPGMAFFAYLLYPFQTDMIQIRNFIACGIVFLSIRYLFDFDQISTTKEKVIRIIKYIICIAIACGFQLLSIFYALFLFVVIKNQRKKKVCIFIIVCILLVLLYTNYVQQLLLGNTKYRVYVYEDSYKGMDIYHSVMMLLLIFGNILFSYYIVKRKYQINPYDRFIISINTIVPLFWIVMVFLGNNFYRIFRNLIPMYYPLLLSNAFSSIYDGKKMTIIYLCMILYPIMLLIAI